MNSLSIGWGVICQIGQAGISSRDIDGLLSKQARYNRAFRQPTSAVVWLASIGSFSSAIDVGYYRLIYAVSNDVIKQLRHLFADDTRSYETLMQRW